MRSSAVGLPGTKMAAKKVIKTIHPFPARMAPELVWEELPSCSKSLRVLDPMAGSGTTLVTAKLRGHQAIGFDRDPLAVLIARAWLSEIAPGDTEAKALEVVSRARSRARKMALSEAYPRGADEETKSFVRYWFDHTNRIHLTALSESISRLHDPSLQNVMWCAFSRLIITKSLGASLAMDTAHSRPHRSYDKAPLKALDHFTRSVRHITRSAPFSGSTITETRTSIDLADARHLPIEDCSIDVVITSPPYLNAIDYIRGHKFSLVWMGHSIDELRKLRSTNVGTENGSRDRTRDDATEEIVRLMCSNKDVEHRQAGMLRQYVRDMRMVLSETERVLRRKGKAVFVVGNCNLQDVFVENSKCIEGLAKEVGLALTKKRSRPLPDNRRYLPPPESSNAGKALKKRMREEVIITLEKH